MYQYCEGCHSVFCLIRSVDKIQQMKHICPCQNCILKARCSDACEERMHFISDTLQKIGYTYEKP